jgi:hypothetical protein
MTLRLRDLTGNGRIRISSRGSHVGKAASSGCSKHLLKQSSWKSSQNNDVLGNPKRKLVWVAQDREAEHNYDVIEPKAVLCNMGRFKDLSADELLRMSVRQKTTQVVQAQPDISD